MRWLRSDGIMASIIMETDCVGAVWADSAAQVGSCSFIQRFHSTQSRSDCVVRRRSVELRTQRLVLQSTCLMDDGLGGAHWLSETDSNSSLNDTKQACNQGNERLLCLPDAVVSPQQRKVPSTVIVAFLLQLNLFSSIKRHEIARDAVA